MPFKLEDLKDDKGFQEHITSLLAPLEASKTGLQTDIKKLKKSLSVLDGLDLEALKQDSVKLQQMVKDKETKETDVEKAARLAKEQHDTEMKALKTDVEILKSTNKKLVVDDSLRAQLVAQNIKPELIPSAIQIIKPDVSILSEEGVNVAKVGDKTLAEHVKDWAASEVGKHFALAKKNSGGGGGGGDKDFTDDTHGKFFAKTVKGQANPYYNLTEQIKLKKTNPAMHAELKKKYA